MIFQIHRLEYGKRLFVSRHCCSWLGAARSTTFKINDRLKMGSQIVSISQPQQINSVINRVCLLFCGSHTCYLCEEWRICICWSVDDLVSAFADEGFQCEPQRISSSAAVLQYFDWRTSVSWQRLYATAQDIQNVVEYESSNCQDSGSVSHRRGGSQFSSYTAFAF